MTRKILILIFIFFIYAFLPVRYEETVLKAGFLASCRAAESVKINNINFDNSDSIIFLGTSGGTEESGTNITKKTLTEPDRVFIDIENAVTTFPAKTYEFKNSRLTRLKIAQNSLEPDIVRVVIHNSAKYNLDDIKILKIKNNIIIKLNNEVPEQKYLTQVYRETQASSSDYIAGTVVTSEEQKQIDPTVITPKNETDEIFNKVQQAFKDNSQELVRPNIEQKQARLKSRFFLDKVTVQNENIVISGIGVINICKPFVLTEPDRAVFDLPNTVVEQSLRDKEIKISENLSVKIGQFAPSTARIVIKSPEPESYAPVYSKNLHTFIITNTRNIKNYVTSVKSNLTYFKESNVNSSTDVINISFSEPVIYSLKREAGKINLTMYNLETFDIISFNAAAMQNKNGFSAQQTGIGIYTISIPLKSNITVDCYETLDSKNLRLVLGTVSGATSEKPEAAPGLKPYNPEKETVRKGISVEDLTDKNMKDKKPKKLKKNEEAVYKKIRNKVIIIDPGHGGNDTGAMRKDILEKDLTLQISQKVRRILEDNGFKNVIMTRTSDKTLSLQDRVDISNNSNADIFVSIHINASVKTEINGIETHYYTENGYKVAQSMHKELLNHVSASDRGLFKSKFYVINHTDAPAVLLELGFISNDDEREALVSEKRQVDSAEAIAQGIINYLTECLYE